MKNESIQQFKSGGNAMKKFFINFFNLISNNWNPKSIYEED